MQLICVKLSSIQHSRIRHIRTAALSLTKIINIMAVTSENVVDVLLMLIMITGRAFRW